MKKLFLLDAFALIYRAYFAFSKNPRINSKGMNTSAIFGFTNTLLDILNNEKPTHLGVAFDTSAPTARHIDYVEYKAQRQEVPEDIRLSIPYIKDIIRAFNIPILEMDGYEADDVIGTIARKAEQQDFNVFMMTPDKDMCQLVTEKVFMYKPAKFGAPAEVMGIDAVLEKYDIKRVDQVIDLLGLMGDAVDNIPGIRGVGEKTAKDLLKQFDTVEGVLANTDKLKGALQKKVIEGADNARLSKQLATIIIDAPIDFDHMHLEVAPVNREKIQSIFAELEFKQLTKRVLGEEPTTAAPISKQGSLFDADTDATAEPATIVSNKKTINDVAHTYFLCDTEAKQKELLTLLMKQTEVCFDTETTGIDANSAELVGMSFSFEPYTGYYIPVSATYDDALATVNLFKPFFENTSIAKVGQNMKYDILMLRWYDIVVQGEMFDTMLAHYLLEPDQRHNMTVLCETYLNYLPVPIENLIGEKKASQISMRNVALEQITEYAAEDADVTLQLKHILLPLLHENNLYKLFSEVEIPLMNVLVAMEMEGVAIDASFLNEYALVLQKEIEVSEKDIYEACGLTFNIASPRQLGEVLFDHLKIDPKAKKTKTGQYATGEDVLSKLADKHPAVNKVLEFRELVKLKNTYIDTLPTMVNKRTLRVHTSFAQAVAATGRLSSNNPNLQNIPIRTERGKEIRKAFIARNDKYTLMSADYSQIELRIIAEFSKDESMIDAFKNGIDIHASTASKVYNVALADVTGDMRRNAKMVNFGIIYGISAFGLSQRLNIPRGEAKEIIDNYFAQYPTIKAYMDGSIQQAREKGYVETILGRKRYLRDINSANAVVRGFAERNAINAPIQGSAADLIKVAMINIYNEFRAAKFNTKMTLQVHDELVFDVPLDEVEIVKPVIRKCMREAIKMTVPLEVEIGVGHNWLEAH
ncbi:MAG: DNA polymerase I [Bacteroidetes bacterium]|nr:DNA polymerase I [Bacteroidota bacterium]